MGLMGPIGLIGPIRPIVPMSGPPKIIEKICEPDVTFGGSRVSGKYMGWFIASYKAHFSLVGSGDCFKNRITGALVRESGGVLGILSNVIYFFR